MLSATVAFSYRVMPQQQTQRNAVWGSWVAGQRKALGWNQKRLSERADLDQGYISKIENGFVPLRATVVRLIEALTPIESGERTAKSLMTDGLRAAGFVPNDDDEDLTDPRFAVVREAFNNADDDDRDYLTETAKRLQKARLAQDAARRGAIGRGTDTE